jgi:predicted dehydrogenase
MRRSTRRFHQGSGDPVTLSDPVQIPTSSRGPDPDTRARAVLANPTRLPRLGFLGVGWIGRQRMEVLGASGLVEVATVFDPSREMCDVALDIAPEASLCGSFDELLEQSLDGVVIATPSALHAEQAVRALEAGCAVFCQKPLGRNSHEVAKVIAAAARADRLLGVDLSYRFVQAFRRLREVVRAGEIGRVYAAELVFHNAYGPDKSWFYDPVLAGGGCVMDLGVHLVDMVLWVLDFPEISDVHARLFASGGAVDRSSQVEDYATIRVDLVDGVTAQIACSWNLPAGQDAMISAVFYGRHGGMAVRNVHGSFYDFVAERYRGTQREVLVEPPDAWPGLAAVDWARRLRLGHKFDPAADQFLRVAETLDRIYVR